VAPVIAGRVVSSRRRVVVLPRRRRRDRRLSTLWLLRATGVGLQSPEPAGTYTVQISIAFFRLAMGSCPSAGEYSWVTKPVKPRSAIACITKR
jgi:hypothetical protein